MFIFFLSLVTIFITWEWGLRGGSGGVGEWGAWEVGGWEWGSGGAGGWGERGWEFGGGGLGDWGEWDHGGGGVVDGCASWGANLKF
jgi:hypothetical protein